ncbi:malto-oligosyltrehalose trehalohydrolase [Mycetocola zhadangensis]|uniref:Malto-oligosyltrehalose trehalohydrolase n=1 Tax=Mycetocola zhadangensis TaxID=1164595 RepID=A0A3L7J7C6_9MICO|nr:malto-oligosyltrehalose trehalohydrolase [Mycetocola zhadangensis]RLQ86324.1 malto-oligosyltrehalose trehalohydrolase [Mycetocola zhadangensis]GGE90184.1 malto-oligosyltrehalose trehalohydrolase [Mycetocola zhadangensis]
MISRRHREPLTVWAPAASRVDLVLGDSSIPMTRGRDAWWVPASDSLNVGSETDYGFLIDGEGPFPDPRSLRQPEGVHGLSRTYDPATYRWKDSAWSGRQLAGGVIYEMHVGTFTPDGTLDSAIDRLDHLVELGVDFVEVLPVNGFNGTHNWGYDGVLWYTVSENYGGPAAYQRFVDACHAAGLGVIQDVVYNHLGPSGNYLPKFGPYLTDGPGNTWGSSVNLDGEHSDQVRNYILENALMWLDEYHVDGLRLDAVHALVDSRATHLLEEMATEVAALSAAVRRPLTLIAESDLNDPTLITPREANGYGLDGQWSDDFHHAVHVALSRETTGYYADFEPLSALAKVLTRGFFHDGTFSSFRGRIHGRAIDTERMPAWRLVVANQNHDQIGNRATGDRLSASLDSGQLAIAAALTLTSPFTPMLFMGEEWGAKTPWQFFTSHPEPELGKATAEGRIAEFERMGWDPNVVPDPQEPSTFANSKLNWDELQDVDSARLLDWYRELTALRRSRPDLLDPRFGATSVEFDEDERWLVLRRGSVAIVINFDEQEHTVSAPVGAELLSFASDGDAVRDRREGIIQLAPHSVLIAELTD